MGIAERREREKQELRDKILTAAEKMFREEGFEKTTLRKIAKAIEYSVGTIYLYFKNKDEILFALHEEGFNLLNNALAPSAKIDHPVQRLRDMGTRYMEFAVTHKEYYDLMFVQPAPMNIIEEKWDGEAIETLQHAKWTTAMKSFGMLYETVKACIDQGYFKLTDYNVAAFSIWSMVHGMATLAVCDRLGNMFPQITADYLIDQSLNTMIEKFQK